MTDTRGTKAPSDAPSSMPEPDARRAFLCRALGVGTAALGLAVLGPPLVVAVSPVFDGDDGDAGAVAWMRLGAVELFEVGAAPRRVVLKRDTRDAWLSRPNAPLGTIYVQRPTADAFLVHSAVCTHLGCTVAPRDSGFHCPCHGAVFAADGSLGEVEGKPNPAPRPLDTLEWRVQAGSGVLEVQWQRFELNVPEKRPLGGGKA